MVYEGKPNYLLYYYNKNRARLKIALVDSPDRPSQTAWPYVRALWDSHSTSAIERNNIR